MTVSSMTGFARTQGQASELGLSWAWEVRSVNGKGLDLRLRLPPGYEGLEVPIRDRVHKALTRGSVSISLQIKAEESGTALRVNEPLLRQLMEMAKVLPAHIAPPTFDGLLSVRGVLEMAETETDAEALALRDRQVLVDLESALDALKVSRDEEGARLEVLLLDHLRGIEDLVARAETTASARPEAARERLTAQLALLLEAAVPVSEDRLAQELALLATKQDVREELDRLGAHIAQARALLADGGACGRRLDFLCQEFNREANTLCSKAQDNELTRIGLDLKAVIDQMREQIQNIE